MFGDHAAFIVPAYGVSFIVILALVIWLKLQYSNRQRELALLEQSGIKRRADKPSEETSDR